MEEANQLLCSAVKSNDLEKVKTLIKSGADVTHFDDNNLTPLMHAAKTGNAEIVAVLLESGAPWNALTPTSLSAGDFAMEEGNQEAFDLLLKTGIQSELILGTIARNQTGNDNQFSNQEYLQDRVSFSEDKLMDGESKGVMMAWEKPLMEAHAKAICSNGGSILNIGFGMGLVDTAIQRYNPIKHTIVEAHPEVYKRMIETGWDKKPNVRIVFGRWQDVLEDLLVDEESDGYDGIFFDTYGEYYEDLREFHMNLPRLLKKPDGVYSYFNGFCGSNAFFHVVYCNLVSLEIESLGFKTDLVALPVKDCLGDEVWEGVKKKYWELDTYYLPVCQFSE